MLSSNLATNLRWRYIQIEIYPLNFLEYLQFNQLQDTLENFYQYICYGWLPYICNLEKINDVVYDYLKNISDTIVLHDIVERFSIRNVSFFHNLLKFSSLNIWNIFSSTNISAFLKSQNQKISPTTILDYLNYLKQAYVLNECPRYDIKWKKLFEIRQKYFFTDIWIRNVIVGWYKKSDIWGILENIVFMSLKSNGWNINIWEIDWKEIDFVCEKNGNIIYIQVSYIIEKEETLKREMSSLETIKDNRSKYIITMDNYTQNEKKNWIIFMNIKDFIIQIEKDLVY
jgi:predicted AAA+ superfamily ATPase